jgi:hypothetical protein
LTAGSFERILTAKDAMGAKKEPASEGERAFGIPVFIFSKIQYKIY